MLSRIILNQCAKSYSTQVLGNEKITYALGKERSLNQVQIIGRVGTDPKTNNDKISPSVDTDSEADKNKSKKMVLFSLATNEYQGKVEGESRTRVDWHRVVVFNTRLQENVEKFVRQGDRLHVIGKLHYNLVKDKTGFTRYVPSIVAEDIIFLAKLNSN